MFICVCLCPSWLLCCTCASPEIFSCVALGHTVFFVKRQVVQLVSSVCSWARGLGCHDFSLVSVEVEKPPPVGPSGILTFSAGDGYVLSWFWCVRVLLCRLPVQLVTRFVQKGLEFTNSECPLCRLKAYLGLFGCLHHTCNRTLFPFCGCILVKAHLGQSPSHVQQDSLPILWLFPCVHIRFRQAGVVAVAAVPWSCQGKPFRRASLRRLGGDS